MASGQDEVDARLTDVYVVGPLAVRASPDASGMVTEDLSLKDRAQAAAIKLTDVVRSVIEQTREAAENCEWEVTVSGVFGVGSEFIGAQAEFNASIRISSGSSIRLSSAP